METIILKHGILFTMNKDYQIIENGAVVVEGNRIIAVGRTEDIEKEHKGDMVIDAYGKAIIPGLINIHMHSASLRGTSDDLPLSTWLEQYIRPYHRSLSPDDLYNESMLAYTEAVKSGTTCLLEMQSFSQKAAEAAAKVGVRVILAPYCGDRPIGENYLDSLEDNEDLICKYNNWAEERIKVWVGLHGFFDSTPEYFVRATELAKKYKTGIHTHTNESRTEVETVSSKYGKDPIECLAEWGVTGPNCVLAHCVWLSNKEIKILKETNTSVAHCPGSNMKLASGIAPISTLLNEKINVGLGTDSIFSKNNLDMFEEMRYASLLQRVNNLDPTLMPSRTTFRMATIDGAKALGLDHQIGSIEPGKKADIVTINLKNLRLTPILLGETFNVDSNLVYAARGDDVVDVLVDGKVIVKEGKIKTINENKVIVNATQTAKRLLKKMQYTTKRHKKDNLLSSKLES